MFYLIYYVLSNIVKYFLKNRLKKMFLQKFDIREYIIQY